MADSEVARAGITPSRQAAWLETGRLRGKVAEEAGEEHRATIHGFFSLDSFEEGSGMLTQREAWRPASFGYLGCLVTTPVDEFGPNGYELHAISRSNWEQYPEWTHLSFPLRKAAQNKAADFSIRKVRA